MIAFHCDNSGLAGMSKKAFRLYLEELQKQDNIIKIYDGLNVNLDLLESYSKFDHNSYLIQKDKLKLYITETNKDKEKIDSILLDAINNNILDDLNIQQNILSIINKTNEKFLRIINELELKHRQEEEKMKPIIAEQKKKTKETLYQKITNFYKTL
jgi:hypothetical protein